MVNWDHIDTVLLDMDGTLLDLHFDNHFWLVHVPARYADRNDMPFEDACARLHPHMREIKGTLDWYDIHYWSRYTEMDILALKQEVVDRVRPRPGAVSFLEAIQNKHTVLATNAHIDTVRFKFARVPLEDYFDQICTSHELGAPKESADYWLALQTETGYDPARTLFIDDNEAVLDAANDSGIAHILTIEQPDLYGPRQTVEGFKALEHFDQITPVVSR